MITNSHEVLIDAIRSIYVGGYVTVIPPENNRG